MSALAILHDAEQQGIRFEIDDDRLVIDAPDDVLTDDLIVEIKAHKDELLAALKDDGTARRRTWGGGDLVDNTIAFAVAGLPITAEAVRKALSPEDIEDILVGDLRVENVRAFAQSLLERGAV